jgi:uncharacterized membrane protein YgdD (TMEM256/DUF423 family)
VSWISVGAVWGFLAVALGAFGAHGLKRIASPEQLAWWETAARYHLAHALALMLVGLLQAQRGGLGPGAWSLLLGSLVFSGTLYAMAIGAPRWLGAVTPLGGLGMLAGWLLLAWAAWRR